jgi:hypothetical protein
MAKHTARMPQGPADQPKSAGQVNVYWRRRVIALVAGLGMLALVTWAVNGALGGGSTRQASDLSQTTGHHSAPPAPDPGSATPGTVPGSTVSSSTVPSSTVPGSTVPSRGGTGGTGAAPSPTGKPRPAPSPSATHHRAAAGGCSGADLVLSLSSARYSYPAHARPQFDVSVVSTARGRCTAALGAGHLHILIRTGGKTRVWDSADCDGSAAPRVTTLARGVPAVVQFTWNRTASAPGCRRPHRSVRPGTYTAIAYRGNLSSHAVVFVLKGRGIAAP